MATLTGGRGWLDPGPAASVHRIDAEMGRRLDINSAGRLRSEQQALWNRWLRGGASNRPPYLYQPARPGSSPHEAGNALDTDDQSWMLAHGGKHGWRRNIPSDKPHFIYEPSRDQFSAGTASVGTAQRQVLSTLPVRRRVAPSSQSALAGAELKPGEVGNFVGWVNGEVVNGNGVWFQGISGHWFWSGGFTNQGTAGLSDLNPAAPVTGADDRVVLATIPVRTRSAATISGAILGELPAGSVQNFGYWTRGDSVESVDIWFVTDDKTKYAWAGGFTSQSTAGLVELVEVPTQTPVGTVLDPAMPWKSQTPDSPLATWIGSPNYDRYPSSPDKRHITLHWITGSLASADAQFQKPGSIVNGRGTNPATNYGVGPNAIHQYIKESAYQHGDGHRESNTYGISVEHEGGQLQADGTRSTPSRATLDNGAKLLADIAKRNGWSSLIWMGNVFPHSHWTATMCPGTLDYAYEIEQANLLLSAEESEVPEDTQPMEPPEVDETFDRVASIAREVGDLLTYLNSK